MTGWKTGTGLSDQDAKRSEYGGALPLLAQYSAWHIDRRGALFGLAH